MRSTSLESVLARSFGFNDYQTRDLFYLATPDDREIFRENFYEYPYSPTHNNPTALSLTRDQLDPSSPYFTQAGESRTVFVQGGDGSDVANLHEKTGYPETTSWWRRRLEQHQIPNLHPHTLVYLQGEKRFYLEVRTEIGERPSYYPLDLSQDDIDTRYSPYYRSYGDAPFLLLRAGTAVNGFILPKDTPIRFRMAQELTYATETWPTVRPFIHPVTSLMTAGLDSYFHTDSSALHHENAGWFHLLDLPFYIFVYMTLGTRILAWKPVATLFSHLPNIPTRLIASPYTAAGIFTGFCLYSGYRTYTHWVAGKKDSDETQRNLSHRAEYATSSVSQFREYALSTHEFCSDANTLKSETIVNGIETIAYGLLGGMSAVGGARSLALRHTQTIGDDFLSELERFLTEFPQASTENMHRFAQWADELMFKIPSAFRALFASAIKTRDPRYFLKFFKKLPGFNDASTFFSLTRQEIRTLLKSLSTTMQALPGWENIETACMPAFRASVFILFLYTRALLQDVLPQVETLNTAARRYIDLEKENPQDTPAAKPL